MIADECLNRIIKSTCDGHALKIQFELYNEIHRNGKSKILRAALKRFGLLSHTIRPVKGTVYVSNLVPCIVAISKRQEGEVIDTLAQSLPLILDALGPIMRDKHVKTLLKAFYLNLSSPQAIFRRNAANMILATCLRCQKPRVYLFYALRYLIDTVITISDVCYENVHLVVGILGCLKIMIPYIDHEKLVNDPETDTTIYRLECLLQIYELCLRYIQWHFDHNVVNAALETLAQLFRLPNQELIIQLTSKNGITGGSRILAFQKDFSASFSNSANINSEVTLDKCRGNIEVNDNVTPILVDNFPLNENEKAKDERANESMKTLNIGSFTDSDVSLKYCCRYLASSFLLAGKPGELVPDKLFRVSIKSLTLICLANAIRLYPNILLAPLELAGEKNKVDQQMMSDILLFTDHSDPQLRGNVSTIIAYFLNAVYVKIDESYSCLKEWNSERKNETGGEKIGEKGLKVDKLAELLIKGLKDESSLTCRQTLIALNVCLTPLLESKESTQGLKIVSNLLLLVKNPYFLVKISLSYLLSELPFISIKYLENDLHFQDAVLEILMQLLSDHDHRVRSAASESIIKFVRSSFIEGNLPEDEVAQKVSQQIDEFLNQIITINPLETRMYQHMEDCFSVNNLIEPFSTFYKIPRTQFNYQRDQLEDSLSLIIKILFDKLSMNPSKYQYFGCFETLNQLSHVFPTTLFPEAWDCRSFRNINEKKNSKVCSSNRTIASEILSINIDFSENLNNNFTSVVSPLLSLTINLLLTDPTSLDLSTHKHMLLFAGNLMSGVALKNFKYMINQPSNETDSNTCEKMWNLFQETEINSYIELLLTHVMRVINIFVHVIDHVQVKTPSGKIGLRSLPLASSLSPRKKNQNIKINNDNLSEPKIKEKNPLNSSFKSSSYGKDIIGSFSNLTHYMKLYEILKVANSNYNSTLDAEASHMYLELLNSNLEVLSQILEIISTCEARKLAEEILHYLGATLSLSPTITIQCVRQLLKSLFSTNLSARWDELEEIRSPEDCQRSTVDDSKKGIYERCFRKPSKQISTMIKLIGNNCRHNESESNSTSTNHNRRDSDHKMAMAFKSFARSNNQRVFFASFIRIFETMVIKSLNHYITTNLVFTQCQVLSLLSQLVQFHVNYCLLDTDKTFIDFVLGQFPFIEEGQIPNVEILLPRIIGFLVHLSYEKYHTKIIIDIPEIIKLCDGLMASEQPALTHCIPALTPVVEYVFLSRSKVSALERQNLDTAREYLMTMLLRLVEHHPVIELLAQCLSESRYDEDGEKKWRKWSRMTLDTVISALAAGRIRIESEEAAIALIKLFSVFSPMVLRPIDPLLKILFTVPPSLDQPKIKLERWFGMVNIVLLSLISYAKEDVILSRLNELCLHMSELVLTLDLPHTFTIYDTVDPLNATNTEFTTCRLSPEQILSIFMFRVIFQAVSKISQHLDTIDYRENRMKFYQDIYLVKELSFFLQLCIHMFESRSHCKIANAITNMIKDKSEFIPIDKINNLMLKLMKKNCSILLVQWIYLTTLLGYNKDDYWPSIIKKKNVDSKENIYEKIVRQCAMILFCDYICKNMNNMQSLTWLLVNNIEEIINLSNESPVRGLVTAAFHRNSVTSKLLVETISLRHLNFSHPVSMKKLLRSLETAHESQSGAVLRFIIRRFLDTPRLSLVKIASKIAIKRTEFLLSLSLDEISEQLPKNHLIHLMEILKSKKFEKQNPVLVAMINNLAATFYGMLPIELEYCRHFNPLTMKNLVVDKNWFLFQIKKKSYSPIEKKESARLLASSVLNIDDCDAVIMSKQFNLEILADCIIFGSRMTIEENSENTVFTKAKNALVDSTSDKKNFDCFSAIYISSQKCLFSCVKDITQLLSKPHNVYDPFSNFENENEYTLKFEKLMEDEIYLKKLFAIIPAVTEYVKTLGEFQERNINCTYSKFDDENLAHFSVLCLETTHWMIYSKTIKKRHIKPSELEMCLNCSAEILKNEKICQIIGNEKHYTWICSIANTLATIVDYWSKNKNYNYLKNPKDEEEQSRGLIAALKHDSTRHFACACLQMSSLISWLKDSEEQFNKDDVPYFIKDPVKALIIIISRQELVNSFVLTPSLVWKNGWMTEGSGSTLCHFPLLLSTGELNFLQDLQILEQFVYGITLLGWTSRQQFEEIWMVLLAVLNDSMETASNKPQSISSTIIALQGISKILIGTLMLPQPGNPVNSVAMHNCRDPPLSLQKSSCKKLYSVQDLISWKYKFIRESKVPKSLFNNISPDSIALEHIFTRGNMERENITHGYSKFSNSQLSVFYLWASSSLHEDKLSASVIELTEKRKQALAKYPLDLDSCIRFLIELFSRWMQPNSNLVTLKLLEEVVQCLVSISDLFVERGQFQWMLDTCSNLQRLHSSNSEILQHSLVLAVCKSAAVLMPLDSQSLQKIKKSIDIGLKLNYTPGRISTLHGILYLLQSAVQTNYEETINVIHPLIFKYIQQNLNGDQKQGKGKIEKEQENEEHKRVLWTVIFFLLEHTETNHSNSEPPAILKLVLNLASVSNISVPLHRTILQGLERLVATRSVIENITDQIIRVSLDRLKHPNILFVIPALRLLITCMYTECADKLNQTHIKQEMESLPDIDAESLIRTFERTSAIFDRIKKGHTIEVEIMCTVLSEIMADFFSPFETLTKVIGEFLSPQQTHQKMLSGVVFSVCKRIVSNTNQLALLQDWVVFSLPNFIQSLPLATSTWCLTCFFVSASTNQWLRALYPFYLFIIASFGFYYGGVAAQPDAVVFDFTL